MINKYMLIISAVILLLLTQSYQEAATGYEKSRFEKKAAIDLPVTYSAKYLSGLDFPVGAVGGSVIRMNGKAERQWWQIFNNFEERAGSGIVPNSFFALRAKTKEATVVKALQTSSVGDFPAMDSLNFQGEFTFGWYSFADDELPVDVRLEAYNPLIPMDLKNSAIPCGIFSIKVKNPSSKKVEIDLLATQQNAVGFHGYYTITGPNNRHCKGYGQNKNTIVANAHKTSLQMTGAKWSMQLSAYAEDVSYTASWKDLTSLYNDFSDDGKLTGEKTAISPEAKMTVDGALATGFSLQPGEEKTITFVLSWHFPKGTFGRSDIPEWYFVEAGSIYENWWANASEVDNYVAENLDYLEKTTRLYHKTMYSSTLPRYVLDRISSNLSVLKSPTSFWTKDGYFGIWESTSSQEEWFGNCKHVLHYAQGHARVFPELGRILRNIDLNTQTSEGLLPSRDGELKNAMDGHFGTILGVYREHLLSTDNDFLATAWPRTKKALDYVILNYDTNRDGMLSGTYHNTLDCNSSGTSPWIGSLYVAALKASAQMALLMGEKELSAEYSNLANTATTNQNQELWSEELGYYIATPEYLPDTRLMDKACGLDMLLGQWWANQLNLGRIYPIERSLSGLNAIYRINRFTEDSSQRPYRDFLGNDDIGWQMFVHPDTVPKNSIHYYCENMTGFEYAAAATMIQHGLVNQGLEIVKEISKRYDGRFRGPDEVTAAPNATVFGSGSPFGEDECGDYYARAMSSWSVLLALQGYIYDGPQQTIGFKPLLQPEEHSSFFTTSAAWGLFSQTQNQLEQTADIEVKFGTARIKNIILAAPDQKSASNISVKLDGVEQVIEGSKQDGDTITIHLKSASEVRSDSRLTIFFSLNI
ncbi:GH116 family glycosyl-hydrolase [Prolixibacteraceae bacterium Z1-6]|uniref:GH116 family glycosyl-hydrolase n=1 Tax=Draconibacterium aestuarii TaxID=2998507 RepID=A0A9X3JA80_9BACT|nr:GH116 family glycosyl-hydrolase [Prolixibacteraceae bacterium Z1-6]